MFGLCRNVSSTQLAKQILRKRVESIQCETAGDHERHLELRAEIAALEEHLMAMRESGLA